MCCVVCTRSVFNAGAEFGVQCLPAKALLIPETIWRKACARGSAVDEWVCAEGFGYRYVRRAVGNEGRLGDGCGDGWTSRLWPDEMDVGECLIPSLYGGLGKQMDRHTMQNYAPSTVLCSALSRKIHVRIAYLKVVATNEHIACSRHLFLTGHA